MMLRAVGVAQAEVVVRARARVNAVTRIPGRSSGVAEGKAEGLLEVLLLSEALRGLKRQLPHPPVVLVGW